MYPIEILEIKNFESAKKAAELLYYKAGKPYEDYYDKNACLVLAAMLLYLKKDNKLNSIYLYRLFVVSYRNYEQFFKRVRDDKDIAQNLKEIFSLQENKDRNTLYQIWTSLRDVIEYLDSYTKLTLEEYKQKRSDILREIKLKNWELSNLTERYIRTCPESEWIGKKVRAYAVTETPGELKDAGTGYLKGIRHLEGNLFYYQIFLENEDGTPSQETYTGPIIVKVELIEN